MIDAEKNSDRTKNKSKQLRKGLVEEVVTGESTNTIPDFGDGRT